MAINKEDVLEALGFDMRTNWMGTALAGFGVGCLVGAAAAILLAPKSGAELRSDIMERGRDLVQRGREQITKAGDEFAKAGDKVMGKAPSNTPTY